MTLEWFLFGVIILVFFCVSWTSYQEARGLG